MRRKYFRSADGKCWLVRSSYTRNVHNRRIKHAIWLRIAKDIKQHYYNLNAGKKQHINYK